VTLSERCTGSNHFTAGSAFLSINLSQHGLLRTLEVLASCILNQFSHGPLAFPSHFMHVLSTITSPASFEVVVVYLGDNFHGIQSQYSQEYQNLPPVPCMSQADRVMESSHHCVQFRVPREIHKARGFRLVLRADIWNRVGEYPVQRLEEGMAVAKAQGVFDVFFPKPLVIYNPWKS